MQWRGKSGFRGNMRGCDLGLLRGLGVRGGVVSSRGRNLEQQEPA